MKLYSGSSCIGPVRPLLRSLLQKTVRRGYEELSQKVAFLLAESGDSPWLHARTGIIVFEECWSCAQFLNDSSPSVLTLKKVAGSFKNKDAAGLGSLAHATIDGNTSAIKYAHDPLAVKIVVAALKRPAAFFKWALTECASEEQAAIVSASQRYFARASWPWDKAFMVAGAYLSSQNGVQPVTWQDELPQGSFPYWVAVDKHTPQGKIALGRIAAELRISELQLQWASFYFESAKVNAMVSSPWWECELKWRFEMLGMRLMDAEDMWNSASPHLQLAVQKQADSLLYLMNKSSPVALL